MIALAGDIGGTNARFLLSELNETSRHNLAEATYQSLSFTNAIELVTLFLNEHDITQPIDAICLAVAGPVNNGVASITNLPWDISEKELSEQFNTTNVKLLNDFVAIAEGLPTLKHGDLVVLNRTEQYHNTSEQNISIIGAGTGFGTVNLVWDSGEYKIIPAEVGHSGFAPENELQTQLLAWLQKKHAHVSLEMVLSGSGLVVIYQFLHEVRGIPESKEVKEKINSSVPAQVISDYALAGKDPLCEQALNCFIDIYGSAAGNVALHYFSSSRMYIAGGIAAKIKDKMTDGRFLQAFFNKGKMSEHLKKVSVKLILQDKIGLHGALEYIENHFL